MMDFLSSYVSNFSWFLLSKFSLVRSAAWIIEVELKVFCGFENIFWGDFKVIIELRYQLGISRNELEKASNILLLESKFCKPSF